MRGLAYRRTVAHLTRVKHRNNYTKLNSFTRSRFPSVEEMCEVVGTKEKLKRFKCDCEFCRPQAKTVEFTKIKNKHKGELHNA
jgi:hypothetical protein